MARNDDKKMTSAKLTQLCAEFEQQAVSSPAEWVTFMTIASNLSAYQPSDQLLVYGQRPNATAVTTYDYWMTKVKRAVKKNAAGIAIFPPKSSTSRSIRYVFDVSDTRDGYYDAASGRYVRADNDRMFLPSIIRLQDEEMILDVLRQNPNVNVTLPDGISIEDAMQEVARQRVEANLDRYVRTIKNYAPEDSRLLALGEEEQTDLIRQILTSSAAYMIAHKVGIDSVLNGMEHAFDRIGTFSYNGAVIWLGSCLAHICTPVQNAIRNHLYELQREGRYDIKAAQDERRSTSAVFSEEPYEYDDNRPDRIPSGGGLSDPEHRGSVPAAGGDIRPEMAQIHGGEPRAAVDVPADEGEAGRDRVEGTGRDGRESDAMGGRIPPEASPDPSEPGRTGESPSDGDGPRAGGRRNSAADSVQSEGRIEQDLNDAPSSEAIAAEEIPSEEAQTQAVKKAVREETTPAAFLVSDAQIDEILRTGSGFEDNRMQLLLGELTYIDDPETLAQILKNDFSIQEDMVLAKGYVIDSDYISVLMEDNGVSFSKGTRADTKDMSLSWEEIAVRIITLYQGRNLVKEEYADEAETTFLNKTAHDIVLYFWNRRNNAKYERYMSLPVFQDASSLRGGFPDKVNAVSMSLNGGSLSILREIFQSPSNGTERMIQLRLEAIARGAKPIAQDNSHDAMTESFIPEDEIIRRAVQYAATYGTEQRFAMQSFFEDSRNDIQEKSKYIKLRCNNSGSGSIEGQINGNAKGLSITQNNITQGISYNDIARIIDTQIKSGTFLPDNRKEEYLTYKENIEKAGITYTVLSGGAYVAEGIQLDEMMRLMTEDPARSVSAQIRGRNGITISYSIIQEGILCPEELYRPVQIRNTANGQEKDERENDRDFALMTTVMREHIPQIVAQMSGIRIIPTSASTFQKSVVVNIIASNNAAFHGPDWNASRPDPEALIQNSLDFDVFARYIDEISSRYERAGAEVFPSYVTFDVVANAANIHDTLVKEGTYRHTVHFTKGMKRLALRSKIVQSTPSQDERDLLSEETETKSIQTLRERGGSESVFRLTASAVSPIMLEANESDLANIILGAPDVFPEGRPLYLSIEKAKSLSSPEAALQWRIAAYEGAREVVDYVTINRLNESFDSNEDFYLKDAAARFIKNHLNLDGEELVKSLRPVEKSAFRQMRETLSSTGKEELAPIDEGVHLYIPFEGTEDLAKNGSIEFDASGVEFAWKIRYDLAYGPRAGHYEYDQSGLLSYAELCSVIGISLDQAETRTLLRGVSESETPEGISRGDVFQFRGDTYVVYTASGTGQAGRFYAVLEEDPQSEDSLYAIHYSGNYMQFLSSDGTFEKANRKREILIDQTEEASYLRPEEGDIIRTPAGNYLIEKVYPGDIYSLRNTDPEADRQRETYQGSIPAPYQTMSRKAWPVFSQRTAQQNQTPEEGFPFESAVQGESFSYDGRTYTLLLEDPESSSKTFRVENTESRIQEGDRFEWNGALYEVFQTVPSQPYLDLAPKGIYAFNLSKNPEQYAAEFYGSFENILRQGQYAFHPSVRTVTLNEGSQQSYRMQLSAGSQEEEPRLYKLLRHTYGYPIMTENGARRNLRNPIDLIHEGDRLLLEGVEKTVTRKTVSTIFLKENPDDNQEEELRLTSLPDAFVITNRKDFQYKSVTDQIKESISDLTKMRTEDPVNTEKDITAFNALLAFYRSEKVPAFSEDPNPEQENTAAATILPDESVPDLSMAPETDQFLYDGIETGRAFTFLDRIFRYEGDASDGGREYSFWDTVKTAKNGDRFTYRGALYEIMERSGDGGKWVQSGFSWQGRLPQGLQAVNISAQANEYGLEIYGDFVSQLQKAPDFTFLPMKRTAIYHAPLYQLPEEDGIQINETIGSERPLSHLSAYNYHYLNRGYTNESLFTEEENGTFRRFDGKEYHVPTNLSDAIEEGDIIRFTSDGRLGNGEMTYLIRKKRGSVLFGSDIDSTSGTISQSIQAIHPLPETVEIIHRQSWPSESVLKQVSEELAKVERKVYALQSRDHTPEEEATYQMLNANAQSLRKIYESITSAIENRIPAQEAQQNTETIHSAKSETLASPGLSDSTARPTEEGVTQTASSIPQGTPSGNYHISYDTFQNAPAQVRARRNIEAIRTLKRIESETRYATKQEQEVMSRYVGWGGLSMCFEENDELRDETEQIRQLLTKEEYEKARESTLTAFFTPPEVIRAIYGTLSRMGFRGGSILEPSMGTGNFFGMLPEKMEESRLQGVELDPISSRIAKLLYPENSNIITGAFENATLPDNYYDIAIGNVPFGSFSVADRRYDRHHFPIHEYFFAKALDKVRPGGILALISSRYLLDKKDSYTRRYLAQRADLLGAVRLPEETFQRASGTSTVCDIVFLKKRDSFSEDEPEWVFSSAPQGMMEETRYNTYFQNHPEMVIGDMEVELGQWGYRPTWRLGSRSLSVELQKSLENIKGSIEQNEAIIEGAEEGNLASIPADPDQMNFTYTERNGEIFFKENARMYRVNLSGKRLERIRGMVRIKDAMLQLILAEGSGDTDQSVKEKRETLNRVYDEFVEKYGHICEAGNRRAFMDDASYCMIASLEDTNEHNEFLKKSDMFTKRTIRPEITADFADTALDALTLSLRKKGSVDLTYMSEISSIPEEALITELAGRIYKDPESGTYLSADDYLSGNIRQKLRIASEAAASDQQYTANVTALEGALPKWVSASDIEVHMGAVWIDVSYYEQFMYEYLETGREYQRGGRFSWASIQISYDETTASYTVEGKERGNGFSIASYTKGTTRANGYVLMESALNQKSIQIKDPERMDDGRIEYVLNFPATQAAQEKQHELERAFEDWIFKDRDRRQVLEEKYNNTYNNITPRKYDGSFFDFPGMSPMIELMEHQKNAVARIVLNHSNTLLGHVVGAGKTFEMIAGCMERKRLGLSQKALFVVPNHLVEQWGQDFYRLYPGCHILVAGQNDFQKNNRKRLFSRMATGDYDAIIIGHSQFIKLPLSKEKEAQYIKAEISALGDSIRRYSQRQATTVKKLEKRKKVLETSIKRLTDAPSKDDVIPFDYLGIDALYIDEAHLFKNLGFHTKKNRIAGVSNTPSQRATDLYLKTKYINEVSGGSGIIFATGTPVSNSMSELYTLMRYLQSPLLQEKGLSAFDAWAAQFGLTIMSFELNTLGTGYRSKERFARFFNLPELLNMFQMSCDIKTKDELDLPGPQAKYHTEETQRSLFQQHIMQELEERSEAIHAKIVDPRDDNMLKITMDGRRVALDQRTYNPDLPEGEDCKTRKCAGNILRLYGQTQKTKGAQLVFCDQSVPNGRVPFNVYDELKRLLCEGGIPEKEIAFIQDASSDTRKKALFSKVRTGEVRVLIGSTEKMGAGMNVQDRLIALHHLDIPWRPADIEQREGRILRQGNMYDEVHIFRYITKDTFDAYSWQLLESKAKFISQIMNTKNVSRSAEDIDENVLSYAEVKALCTGNEDIRRQIMLTGEVTKLKLGRMTYKKEQDRLEENVTVTYPNKIKALNESIALYKEDIALYESSKESAEVFVFHFYDADINDREKAGRKIREILRKNKQTGTIVPIGTYLGFEISGIYAPLQADARTSSYMLIAKAGTTHRYPVTGYGAQLIGNLEESLDGMPNQIELFEKTKEKIEKNLEEERSLLGEPWKKEEEYLEKVKELEALNAKLNLNKTDRTQSAYEIEDDLVLSEAEKAKTKEDEILPQGKDDDEYCPVIPEESPDDPSSLKPELPDPFQILNERGRNFLREGDIIYFEKTRYLVETVTDYGITMKRFSHPQDHDFKPTSRETISLNHNWVNNDELKAGLVIGQFYTKDDTKQSAWHKFLSAYTRKETRELLHAIDHTNAKMTIPNINGCKR